MDRIASLTGNERGDIPGSEEIRQAMGQTLKVAKRINLAKMIPHNELSSTTFCLAEPGIEYLVYFSEMKEGQVDLSGIKATLKVEWFHPLRRIVRQGGKVEGGGKLKFTPPFKEGAVLHLMRE